MSISRFNYKKDSGWYWIVYCNFFWYLIWKGCLGNHLWSCGIITWCLITLLIIWYSIYFTTSGTDNIYRNEFSFDKTHGNKRRKQDLKLLSVISTISFLSLSKIALLNAPTVDKHRLKRYPMANKSDLSDNGALKQI